MAHGVCKHSHRTKAVWRLKEEPRQPKKRLTWKELYRLDASYVTAGDFREYPQRFITSMEKQKKIVTSKYYPFVTSIIAEVVIKSRSVGIPTKKALRINTELKISYWIRSGNLLDWISITMGKIMMIFLSNLLMCYVRQ